MNGNDSLNRAQRLGMVLAACRENSEKTIVKTASYLGITPDELLRYEQGETSPGLPQLELLSDFYRVPLKEMLSDTDTPVQNRKLDPAKVPALVGVRNRIIAMLLKSARLDQGVEEIALAGKLGLNLEQLQQYESGLTQVPLPALELISKELNIPMESFFSETEQIPENPPTPEPEPEIIEPALPDELHLFVNEPANIPFLKMAQSISKIDPSALKALAESLMLADEQPDSMSD